jgi:putative membrane protein
VSIFSPHDADRVGHAVSRAERLSDGEIVTIVGPSSDDYHDVPLIAAAIATLLALALAASQPAPFLRLLDLIAGWSAWTPADLLALLMVTLVAVFLIVRAIAGLAPLRLALTPGFVKTHRVRQRARLLFRITVESRTRAATGVLLYLSLAERRAEIVADAAIASRVTPDTWGAAMAALIGAVKDGRPGDGMVEAVEAIGTVLAAHFPRSPDDTNELPDRLILL